jgi:hypothetical protein
VLLDLVQAAREIEMVSGRWNNQEELKEALKLFIGDEYSLEGDQLKQRQEADQREMYGRYPHLLSLEDRGRSKGKGEDEKAEWWRHRETISDPPKREEPGEEVSNSHEQERSYGQVSRIY